MEIDVRGFDGEARQFLEAAELAFGDRVRDEDVPDWEATFEADRAVAAYDGERIVGTAGILSFDLTIPGGTAPAAGVTIVAVQPTHRRRGILRRMMRRQLDEIHDRGEPIAVLWASEGSIYQRFGYGLATMTTRFDVERHRSQLRTPRDPVGRVRFVDSDEARRLLPPIHDALAPHRPGFFTRTPAFWDAEVFRDPERWRRGASEAFYVVHDTDGKTDGFARYRIREQWGDGGPGSSVVVTDKLALNPAADLDLWQYLLGIDLMAKLEAWNVAPDDPLILNILEPRRLGIGVGDGAWLRVVDLGAALNQRRYAADGRLVLEVRDEFCPWNAGRWSLDVEDGVGRVAATDDAPQLGVDITDLGAAYLGGFTFRQLADAARVAELEPGSLAVADALFHTARPPWCPRAF
jgi:predicted acetyltransferase